jgi:hypothetical protein
MDSNWEAVFSTMSVRQLTQEWKKCSKRCLPCGPFRGVISRTSIEFGSLWESRRPVWVEHGSWGIYGFGSRYHTTGEDSKLRRLSTWCSELQSMWISDSDIVTCTINAITIGLMVTAKKVKGKAIPVTGRGGPSGCERSRLPHFLDNLLTNGGEVRLMRLSPFTPRNHGNSTSHYNVGTKLSVITNCELYEMYINWNANSEFWLIKNTCENSVLSDENWIFQVKSTKRSCPCP